MKHLDLLRPFPIKLPASIALSVLLLALLSSCSDSSPRSPTEIGGTVDLSLPLAMETEHFLLRFSEPSIEVMDVYAAELEGNYHRILSDLGLASLPRVTGNFYPNRASYEAASGHVGATGSVRGPFEFDVVALPLSRSLPVHEFAHNVTLNVNFDVANNPTWLWEAVAVYEALEFLPPASVPCLASGDYPTLAQLNVRGPNCSIYDVGYTLMELVVEDWGLPAMRQLILTNGDTQASLGLTTREFESAWYAFLEARYL